MHDTGMFAELKTARRPSALATPWKTGVLALGLLTVSAPALGPATATRDLPAGLSVEALKNAAYQSGFSPAGVVRLREGAYRAPLVPGSATMLTVQLGAGNIVAGLTQGLPVSGSGSRTAVAEAAGARSQLSALVAAGVVVVVE